MTLVGFVGADPVGLVGLAETTTHYAARIGLVRHQGIEIIRRAGRASGPINAALADVENDLNERGSALRWRAATIEEAQRVGMTSIDQVGIENYRLAEFAALAVFDAARWQEASAAWRSPPSNAELLKMSPAEVGSVFAALAPEVGADLARRRPLVIGSLDGVPPHLRYLANDILIQAEITRLGQLITRLREPGSTSRSGGPVSRLDLASFTIPALLATVIVMLTERVAEYRRWLGEDRQILLFDPDGDGRVVEVFGDLEGAANIGVVVPGMGNTINNFSWGNGGFRKNALDLFDAGGSSGDLATIAWLGYDSPDNVGAAVRIAAEDGAPYLVRFLEGIDPGEDKSVTVVAHSYGSVLAGLASSTGLAANNLVFVGSPGTTLGHADEALLRPDGRVWAGLAEGDPIAWGIAPRELPAWPLLPDPIGYLMGVFTAIDRADQLWHGANPASDSFGASQLTTDGSSGHSDYFEAGSLANLALIVEGRHSEVELVEP